MKKYFRYMGMGILMLTLATFSSCTKHFLDEVPAESFTLDSIFTNRDYAEAALTTVYNMLPQDQLYLSPFGAMAFTGSADEMEMPWPEKYNVTMIAGAWNPSDGPVADYWNNNYNGIRKANVFLENIAKTPMTAAEKSRWIAETHFLRAFFYFNLVRLYGPVPLIDHVISTSEDFTQYKRATLEDLVTFMVHDIDTAASILPMNYTADKDGRVTRAACLALKSRLLLYMASPLFNGNPDYANVRDKDGIALFPLVYSSDKWQKAAEAAKACIDQSEASGYRLYEAAGGDPEKSYQELFLTPWNSEVLFARNESNTWDANDLNRTAFPNGMGGWGGYSATQELVDAYQMANGDDPINGYGSDGAPIINAGSGYQETGFATEDGKYWQKGIRNAYTNREPRFYASINYNGAWFNGRRIEFWLNGLDGMAAHGRDHCVTGYLMKKFVDSTINIPQGKWVTTTWIYFRLGEIYLNYAEALNEVQGAVTDVYKYMNAIRTRAGLPHLPAGLSKENMREKIHHERRIEMAFEMQRYFDCHRWKISPTVDRGPKHGMNISVGNSISDEAFYKRVVTSNRVFVAPKHYLWPVPQGEIDKNKNLVQNIGW
ncbi:MAG TPA: RagB/SusD family nutrient uptake outer membrane protein [Arachidicoccus sp.]|nr:RagB/SusD family nutrient uptake outer membrane protein [Arachidicoccus sp.]